MIDGCEHLLAIAHVRDECRCFRADLGDLVGYGIDAVGSDVDQRDIGSVARQPQRDAAPDTAATAGDERNLAGQWMMS